MVENLRISLRGIWSHKLRSFLTMLGIIIGIAAIITMVSVMQGTYEQIKENLIGSGNNLVTINLFQDGMELDFNYEKVPDGVAPLPESLKDAILAEDKVEAVSFALYRSYSEGLYYKNKNIGSCSVRGIDSGYFAASSYRVARGRGFTQDEYAAGGRICLLDDKAAEQIFQEEEPLGQTLYLQGVPLTVVGIVRTPSSFAPAINSMMDYYLYSDGVRGALLLPSASWPLIYRYDEPQQVLVRAADTDSMTAVGQSVSRLVNDTLALDASAKDAVQYKSGDLLAQAEDIQELSSSSNFMLIVIAAISLLVGGIGVMNIMLVSVTERTREIGLKKAIGATKRQIREQFLTESVLLSVFGGLLGILAGILLAHVFSALSGLPVAISLSAIGIAFGFSVAVGVIFGIIPSIQASNLNPIDALRHE